MPGERAPAGVSASAKKRGLVCDLICPSCQCAASRRALPLPPNQNDHPCIPHPVRGTLRDRHERWARDAMDAARHQTNDAIADGEVVWSRRPDAGAKSAKTLSRLAGDGGKKARSPRNHRAGNAG
jgi:hypothetical protein